MMLMANYDTSMTISLRMTNKASVIKAAILKRRSGVIVSNMEHGHTNFVMILRCYNEDKIRCLRYKIRYQIIQRSSRRCRFHYDNKQTHSECDQCYHLKQNILDDVSKDRATVYVMTA